MNARRPSTLGRAVRWLLVGFAFVLLAVLGTVAGLVAAYTRDLPDINRIAEYHPATSTRIYARDGTLLASLFKENRTYVPIQRVPPIVRDAFIATEDRNFYTHHGVDPGGIARAAIADVRHEQFQGASTITQQLARRLFLTDKISLTRKLQEALLAIEIEHYYTKDEILERYLNLIYFGSGAYGIQAAAHTYFGTDVGKLTLAQAAVLGGLPAAPSDYSPFVDLARAKERQAHVLDRMASAGYITAAEAAAAKDAPLGLNAQRSSGLLSYRLPYFTTYVVRDLDRSFGAATTLSAGLDVYTTVDPAMQTLAEQAVDWGVGQAKSEGIGADEAALVAIRPSTGEILAMVGGTGFSLANQFNRAWQAQRQPGSSFKAFVYTAAIDNGDTPSTVVDDSRVSYPNGDGTEYTPTDDDLRYLGPVTLRYALAQSRNVVAVKLAHDVGVDRVIAYAQRMGIRSPLGADLSLALGTSVVSPLEMASAYGTLANAGIHVAPTAIRMVKDPYGQVLLDDRFPVETEAVSAGTAYIVTSMLESVIAEGTGYPNAEIGRPAAGKTGTTSDFRDAWFVGYTPDLVTAVWLGNDNYHRMRESYGGNVPARIWARFMKAALAKTPPHDFQIPQSEVRELAVCGRPNRVEFYLAGTGPRGTCSSGTGIAVNEPRVAAAKKVSR